MSLVGNVFSGALLPPVAFGVLVHGEISISTIVPKRRTTSRSASSPRKDGEAPERSVSGKNIEVMEVLCRKRPGDFICQQSYMQRESKVVQNLGGATFKAIGNSKLLILSQSNLSKFLETSPETAPILRSILSTDVVKLLEDIPFFIDETLEHEDQEKALRGRMVLADMFAYENTAPLVRVRFRRARPCDLTQPLGGL